jgi:hypothetical protein
LSDCCVVFAYRFREAKEVVGIATETGLRNGGRSHDLLYFGSGEWTPEAEKRAAEIQQERELLLEGKATTQYHHEDEYSEPKR